LHRAKPGAFNSPSRLGSGWRGRPCPRPRFRSLAAQSAAAALSQCRSPLTKALPARAGLQIVLRNIARFLQPQGPEQFVGSPTRIKDLLLIRVKPFISGL